jgi:two-component system, OmpR family, response regulator
LFIVGMIRLHVLFADADPDIRTLVANTLPQDPFFVVRGCATGGEVLEAAREWRPDLAVLDLDMPGLNGPAALAQLRADKRTAAIPVVFVVAPRKAPERAGLKALGAAGLIEKPFDPCGLAAELRRFVPLEGVLAEMRENFLLRLDADARALASCRQFLSRTRAKPVLARINEIAHALAGTGGIYGFAGITCESAALSDAAENSLAGRARRSDVQRALDRLLKRIGSASQPRNSWSSRSGKRRKSGVDAGTSAALGSFAAADLLGSPVLARADRFQEIDHARHHQTNAHGAIRYRAARPADG